MFIIDKFLLTRPLDIQEMKELCRQRQLVQSNGLGPSVDKLRAPLSQVCVYLLVPTLFQSCVNDSGKN